MSDTAIREQVHQQVHQIMVHIDAGQLTRAETELAQAAHLAEEYGEADWAAQIAYCWGVLRDRQGRPVEAIPYLRTAHVSFAASNLPRMQVSTSIFLGNMLAKTGQPRRGLAVLLAALDVLAGTPRTADRATAVQAAHSHVGRGTVDAHEADALQCGLLLEISSARLQLGHVRKAEEALAAAEMLALTSLLIDEYDQAQRKRLDLYAAQHRLRDAMALVDRRLAATEQARARAALTVHDLGDAWSLAFRIGLLGLQDQHFVEARQYTARALDYGRELVQRGVLQAYPLVLNGAFLGRTYVNLGTALLEMRQSDLDVEMLASAFAHWRRGEHWLEQAHAYDVTIPQDNLQRVRRTLPLPVFHAIWQVSEPLYAALVTAETAGSAAQGAPDTPS